MAIGAGPATQELADVVGLTYDAAATQLGQAKLVPRRQDVNNEAPAGTVVATVPRAGAKVTEGQQIVVQVSTGRIQLPDVTNKTLAEALKELNQKGFGRVQPREAVPPDDFEPGVVFQTNPSPGTFVSKDAVITIYVAKAKPSPTPSPTTPSPTPSSSPTTKKPPGSPTPTP